MDVNAKKHVFVFRTATGAMTVGTDDLYELSSQSWFTKFLGVSKQEPQAPPAPSPSSDMGVYDAAALKADVQQMVRAQVNEVAKQMLAEQRTAMPEPPLPEFDPEPELQIEDVAKEAEQEFKRSEAEMAARPDIRKDMPGVGKQNFLDITPNNMTEQIWLSLTPEQQQQYGQKYMS